MKKLILFLLIFLFLLPIPSLAQTCEDCTKEARMSLGIVGGGGPAATGPTYLDDLRLDDNAATATVINLGTRGNWAVQSYLTHPTSDFHSATVKEGTGSFYFPLVGITWAIGTTAWSEEKFEVIFWVRFDNAISGYYEIYMVVGSDAGYGAQNTIVLSRGVTSTQFMVDLCGDNAFCTRKTRSTTDFTPSAATWYKVRWNVDGTGSTWMIHLYVTPDGGSESELTFATGDWATGYAANWTNNHAWFGDETGLGLYNPEARIDAITVEQK